MPNLTKRRSAPALKLFQFSENWVKIELWRYVSFSFDPFDPPFHQFSCIYIPSIKGYGSFVPPTPSFFTENA